MATEGVRKVYGSWDCPNTLKVLACIFEHGLDFVFVPINIKDGENLREPFLSLNPFGELPVLQDGGYTQFESRAIIRCMSHEFSRNVKEELIYWDVRKQAVVANWVDVEDHEFEPPALELINELLIKPENGLKADESIVANSEAKLAAVLDIYEARLGNLKYLASSDRFTIADLVHIPNLQCLLGFDKGKKLIESRPMVKAWCSEILARPAWINVLEMKKKGKEGLIDLDIVDLENLLSIK